jgi:hypothetical protein
METFDPHVDEQKLRKEIRRRKKYRRFRDPAYPIEGTPSIREVVQSPFRDYLFDSEAEASMRWYGVTHKQVIEILKHPTRTQHVTGDTKLSVYEKPRKYLINVFHQPELDPNEKDYDNPRIIDTVIIGVGVVEL